MPVNNYWHFLSESLGFVIPLGIKLNFYNITQCHITCIFGNNNTILSD